MRKLHCTITEIQFQPMADIVNSYIDISFEINSSHEIFDLRFSGSITDLSKKFGFTVTEKRGELPVYHFKDLKGKHCVIREDDSGRYFDHFFEIES